MKRFPSELEAIVSVKGRRVLAGKDRAANGALGRDGVVVIPGFLDAKAARAAPSLLQRALGRSLERRETRAPPALNAGVLSALERIPRVERVGVAALGPAAEEIGLTALCGSESFRRLAEVLNEAPLEAPAKAEALALDDGDYLGPRTGHFTEVRDGAVELFLCFDTAGIRRQFLVHERGGHLEAIQPLSDAGTLIAVRRPRWRYLTPLEVSKKGARRWMVGQSYEPRAGA